MIVRLKKHHLQYFRNKARQTPNEIYAFLIGTRISPTLIQIERFRYPKLTMSTPALVVADVDSEVEIEDIAKLNNYTIVGSLHSHPNYITPMSDCDLSTLKNSSHTVSGVLGIIGDKTFITFWCRDTPLPATIQFF